MKPYFLALLILSLIIFSCKEDSPTSPDDNDSSSNVTETVGALGGSISIDELTITIPSASFTGNSTLTLSADDQSVLITEGSLSKVFKLEGLPAEYSQPIQISITADTPNEEKVFIAASAETYITSENQTGIAYQYLNADYEGNNIAGEIPAPGHGGGLSNFLEKSNSETFNLIIQALGGKEHLSSAGHFKIKSSASINYESMINLGSYLETAYDKFLELDFDYSARTNWPVDVTVRSMSGDKYGYYVSSMWGNNYGYLEFNSNKITDSEEMKLTAGHEFFHLVQALYDNRNRFSKAKFAPAHLWIDEAAAVWAEELFSSYSNYASDIRGGQIMAPFRGMQTGPNNDAQGYGYGMSAVMKYFDQNEIKTIYDKIKAGSHPIESIMLTHQEPASFWWPDFIKKYIEGDIYDDVAPLTLATDSETQLSEIKSDSDTLFTFQNQCADLSGLVYNIKLQNPDFDASSKIKLNLSGDSNLTLLLFKYKGASIEFIGESTSDLIVGDVKSLYDNNYYLLAVVTNSQWLTPFTNMKNVNLTVNVIKDETVDLSKYKYCSFIISKPDVTMEDSNGGEYSTSRNFIIPLQRMEGSFNGNTFTATWSTTEYPQSTGEIEITVDPSTLIATSYSVTETIESDASKETISLAGGNLPLEYDGRYPPNTLSGYNKGTTVSSYISNFSYMVESLTSYYWNRSKSVTFTSESSFTISFREYE